MIYMSRQKIWGYLRVSTEKQTVTNFKSAILDYANEHDLGKVDFISETVSGRKMWENRLLGRVFNADMKDGDTIILSEFSRIGRDSINALSFVGECRKRNITIISLAGDIPEGTSASDNLILAISAFKAHQERELISYRTKQGLRAAVERGVKLGRKTEMALDKDINNERLIRDELEKGIKLGQICRNHDCSRITLRKYMAKHHLSSQKFSKRDNKLDIDTPHRS